MIIPLTLYIVFSFLVLFAPLRWAIAGYLLLACVDFPGNRDSIGLLNTFRGFAVPVYLLWRLRKQSGHRTIILAPVAWGLLIVYAGIASFWSYFPTSALKLVGHMTGSLLIGFVFARAAKGGYMSSRVVVPVTIGSILIAIAQFLYLHNWTGEGSRFSAFTPAQAFAALLAALFCMALCAPSLAMRTRMFLCSALGLSLVFNGSRIWFFGVLLATLIAFIISGARAWAKIVTLGFVILSACFLVIVRGQVTQMIHDMAPSNRIVAAGLAAYEGDFQSQGLGTLRFRREVDDTALDQLKKFTPTELMFGRGTSNGSLVTGSLFRGYAGLVDPNRMMHDEWLRVFYEWGGIGLIFWCSFWVSISAYAIQGVRNDKLARQLNGASLRAVNDPAAAPQPSSFAEGYAKPLVVYLPALLVALAGENFLAGAGSAMSVGFLMLLGFATLAHRYPLKKVDPLLIGTLPPPRANAPELITSSTAR